MIINSQGIPSVGTAEILGVISIVTIRCSCVKKEIIMAQIGLAAQCPSCKKIWNVTANIKMKIEEISILDIEKSVTEQLSLKSM